jgi:hypothetical protein
MIAFDLKLEPKALMAQQVQSVFLDFGNNSNCLFRTLTEI